MSKFKLGDRVVITSSATQEELRGSTGTIIENPYAIAGRLVDFDGDYRVRVDADIIIKKRSIREEHLELLATNAKPGDKVKFLVEGTILREDVHPNNWIVNAPLFGGTGETRHIRKASVVEVTKSLTFEVDQAVPDEDVHLLPLGTVLRESWTGLLVVVGDDSLIYMDSSSLPFRNIDPDTSDEYYVVVSLPKEA